MGMQYIKTSPVVEDAARKLVLESGAQLSRNEQGKVVMSIISAVETNAEIRTALLNKDYLKLSGIVIGISSKTLLQVVGARIGYAAGGTAGAKIGVNIASITANSITFSGAIVTAFALGYMGYP
jgi:hypothetical protein